MSRIDKALRIWEEAAGVVRGEVEATPSVSKANLNNYVPEVPSSRQAAEAPRREVERPPSTLRRFRPTRVTSKVDPDVAARLVTGQVSSVSLEQYRRLAAALHEVQAESALKTVMMTSALPHEGKTLTSVNLALTLSDSYGRDVLVIDADLRWPSVHTVLGVNNICGLSEALADEQQDLPIVKLSDHLSLMTAGRPIGRPLAGLSSPRMGALLQECGRRFDWVVLDTPPVGLLPDAQLLARLAGAVILVIAAGVTPAATVQRAIAEIGQDCIIGTVMNRVEPHRISEAYYYDRYKSAAD